MVVAIVVAIMVFKFGLVIWPLLVFFAGVIIIYGIIDGISKFADNFVLSNGKYRYAEMKVSPSVQLYAR